MRGTSKPVQATAEPPHAVEAEQGVLGSMLLSPSDTIGRCAEKLRSDQLYVPSHKIIFDLLVELWSAGQAIDLITFTQVLRDRKLLDKVGGPAFVTSLFTFVPTAANVDFYIDIVRDKYILRSIISAATETIRRANDQQADAGEVLRFTADNLATLHGRNGSDNSIVRRLIEFRSPLELRNFTPPPGNVLVGDCHIVKPSAVVVAGPPGVGKSRGADGLAVAGATREPWFGLTVHRRFKTMIIQNENGEYRLSKEFRDLDCDVLENYVRICPPPPFGMCFQRDDFRTQLATAIKEFGPDVVVFDPWNAAARDDKQREYLETFDAIRSVLPAGEAAPALVIVAHTRKPKADERTNGRGLLNLLAGSYVLGSIPRTVFVMQAASDETTDDRVVWTCCKNNDGELGPRSAWERRNGLFAPVVDFDWKAFDLDGKDRRQTITEADVAEIFADGPLTKTEAAKRLEAATGASRATSYRALDLNGRFKKHLRVDEEGKWTWQ